MLETFDEHATIEDLFSTHENFMFDLCQILRLDYVESTELEVI